MFGATGFTGELTARALVARGVRPVLAGRNPERLAALADELGGTETALADVERPESVRALVEAGDVLISTVGPFTRHGGPALEAAIDAGAHYLDSTGEPPFIRQVFGRQAGTALLTAMGYDYVPGNLAAALALRDAAGAASRVEIGYFVEGRVGGGAASGGTLASMAGVLLEPGYAYRGGSLRTERAGLRTRSFQVRGRLRPGLSLGGSEHLALPAAFPELRDVDVYLGWLGSGTAVASALSRTAGTVAALPPVRAAIGKGLGRVFRGSSGGPDEAARRGVRSVCVAEALDAGGHLRGRAVLVGENPYDFTGRFLAWAAGRLLDEGPRATGGIGPVEAFGVEALLEGAEASGLQRSE